MSFTCVSESMYETSSRPPVVQRVSCSASCGGDMPPDAHRKIVVHLQHRAQSSGIKYVHMYMYTRML